MAHIIAARCINRQPRYMFMISGLADENIVHSKSGPNTEYGEAGVDEQQ
jgi:hypothetical protein